MMKWMIMIRYNGEFKQKNGKKIYEGGAVLMKSDVEEETMSWFELRGFLTEVGIYDDYIVYQQIPNTDMETGLKQIYGDTTVCQMFTDGVGAVGILLLIEHLPKGTGQLEDLPEWLRPPKPVENVVEGNGEEVNTDIHQDEDGEDGDGDDERDGDDEEYGTDDEWVQPDMEESSSGDEDLKGFVFERRNRDGEGEFLKMVHANVSGSKERHVLGGSDCEPQDSAHSSFDGSDVLNTPPSSDAEENKMVPKFPTFDKKRDMVNPRPQVGMEFCDAAEFRAFIRQYAVLFGRSVIFKKCTSVFNTVYCQGQDCNWMVRARNIHRKHLWMIVSYREDHGEFCHKVNKNIQARAKWLMERYLEMFRADPDLKIDFFKKMVSCDLGLDICVTTAYKARNLAREAIFGNAKQQFGQLRDYALALRRRNPGSFAIVETVPIVGRTSHVKFFGIFISFKAMIDGLVRGCRPVIGMDGCHLSGPTGGVLLSAVSRDGNDQMYPVAYAVVNVESTDTWTWFIRTLVDALGVESIRGWTFITDRQKGLVKSLQTNVYEADCRYCVRHLYGNLKEKWRGLTLKKLFWRAARTYNKKRCDDTLIMLKAENLDAHEYLESVPKYYWCRSYFRNKESKCDLQVNNICEAFNKYILQTRDKPIITMLEMIRRLCMKRFESQKSMISPHVQYDELGNLTKPNLPCPKIQKKIQARIHKSKASDVVYCGRNIYEVKYKKYQVSVNLVDGHCDCEQWDLSGIPCKHAIAAILHKQEQVYDFVSKDYSIRRFLDAWDGMIYPIPDSSQWEVVKCTPIVPPRKPKKKGRPPKARRRGPDEPVKRGKITRTGTVITCSNCREEGHNKRKCKNAYVPPPVKIPKRMGWPRIHRPLEEVDEEDEVIQQAGTSRGRTGRRGRRGRGTVGGNIGVRGLDNHDQAAFEEEAELEHEMNQVYFGLGEGSHARVHEENMGVRGDRTSGGVGQGYFFEDDFWFQYHQHGYDAEEAVEDANQERIFGAEKGSSLDCNDPIAVVQESIGCSEMSHHGCQTTYTYARNIEPSTTIGSEEGQGLTYAREKHGEFISAAQLQDQVNSRRKAKKVASRYMDYTKRPPKLPPRKRTSKTQNIPTQGSQA